MSVDVWVTQVGVVLQRAHSLFGDPAVSGAQAATGSSTELHNAAELVRLNTAAADGLSGELAERYTNFAAFSEPALTGLAGADLQLSTHLEEAAATDRDGRLTSGNVVNAAAADTAVIGPAAATPAGERALIQALRDRVAQQQQVVSAWQIRDARMAALLKQLLYAGAGSSANSPTSSTGTPQMSSPSNSGRGLSLPSLPNTSSLFSALGANNDTPTTTDGVAQTTAPSSAAGRAVQAALSKRGVPYVWGAEGPNSFDCSGLTEWAWRQAGVQLGDDTYTQVNQGVAVSPGDVQAGDLIFPRDSWDSRGPGHVQLAISPTQVVHAPTTGDVVRVAAMPSSFVARRPVV